MKFKITTAVEPEYARITVEGEYEFSEMFEFISTVRSIAVERARNKVLIDCSKLTGQITEAERFQGGQEVARVFGSRIQAALILPASQVTKLGELTAVNRGAKFLVTSSETEALGWLRH